MPVFDFTETAVPGLRVLARMLYPQQDDARYQELLTILTVNLYIVHKDVPEAWQSRPATTDIDLLLDACLRAGAAGDVYQSAKRAAMRGSVAGDVLILARQFATHYPSRRWGINKACRLVAAAGREGGSTIGRIPIGYTGSKQVRDIAWAPYRSVAHWWAGVNVLVGKTHGPVTTFPWFESPRDFELLARLAENFRRWGETFIPHAQRASLLSSDETWRLPDAANFSALEVTVPPEIAPWYLQAM